MAAEENNSSLLDYISKYAENTPESVAMLGPGQQPLTYRNLYRRVQYVIQTLRAMGVRRGDRVATFSPFGLNDAVVNLGVLSCTTGVPLDPNISEIEAIRILDASNI